MPQQKVSLLKGIIHHKCPRCRKGNIYTHSNWNYLKATSMYKNCSHCGLQYEVEPGFFWGAMYIAYALITALFVGALIIFFFFIDKGLEVLIYFISSYLLVILLLVPFILRYSRTLMLYAFGGIKYEPALSGD
ncbi:MAG: DUF983 domain-containing protein [Bacteroidia bacterium]|nr:DUF983 domain-containing protein [Bacteroidia bacterium]MDW8157855.1 DUF983 domain-containing protein [Bacteroidia bacterium]